MSTAVFGPIEVGKIEFQNKTLTETNTHQEWEKMFLSIDWLILIDNSKRERVRETKWKKTKGLSKMKSVYGGVWVDRNEYIERK